MSEKSKKTAKEAEGRVWKFVFYPESAPENFLEIMEDWHIPLLLSPLHDKDTFKDGSPKKPHFHVLMVFEGNKRYHNLIDYVSQLGVNYVRQADWFRDGDGELEKAASRRGDERYLCHLDSPRKFHYDVNDVLPMSGYEPKYLDDEFDCSGIAAIIKVIENNGIVYFADLACECIKNHSELVLCLMRYQAFFNNYLYSRERMVKKYSNDNGSYVKYVTTRQNWIGD